MNIINKNRWMKMSYINLSFKSISSDCINNVQRMTKYKDRKKRMLKKTNGKRRWVAHNVHIFYWEYLKYCSVTIFKQSMWPGIDGNASNTVEHFHCRLYVLLKDSHPIINRLPHVNEPCPFYFGDSILFLVGDVCEWILYQHLFLRV